MTSHSRPRFLNLLQISMPVASVTSILHRLSGVLLFFSLPLLLFLLDYSLRSAEAFAELLRLLHSPLTAWVVLVVLWWFLHHLFAGLRLLAIDLEWGVALQPARTSARVVNWLAPLAALLLWGWWL